MKVLISVTRETEYSTIVEMDEKTYIDFSKRLNSKDYKKAEKELNKLIDVRDWQGDSFKSLDEFKEWEE